MIEAIWLVIVLPLLGVVINGLFGKRLPRNAAAFLGCGTVGGSLLVALSSFYSFLHLPQSQRFIEQRLFTWISVGDFKADAALLVDPLSMVMLLVVTGVGFLIHVYSVGYMWEDPGLSRFFTYLNLFTASMLTLVLANNFALLYVGWEMVGLCSYLLIGFWFHKPSAADAGKKAFIVNRIGDFGFALGIFTIFKLFGSLNYSIVFREIERSSVSGDAALSAVALLLFIGATGKSAQIPLYVWLPDAMEGPTPVSALIHAATMVTAGVYMVARCHVIFQLSPAILTVVAIIGGFTAVFAATIALVNQDIKRVLAYSTISQLGYMFLGCGVGAYTAAIFHLMTHAFFKALLFLGSGSVIHSMEHALHHTHRHDDPQDMRNMGGLGKRMKLTAATFIIGAAALAGVPGLSGFFSKEEILKGALEANQAFWIIGIAGAAMTAFYMTRQVFKTFFGHFRLDEETEHHLHESPAIMTVPLLLLAIGALSAGWIARPFQEFLAPVFAAGGREVAKHAIEHGGESIVPMLVAIGVAALGIVLGLAFYARTTDAPSRIAASVPWVYRLLWNKYYVDELYDRLFVSKGHQLANFLARIFDVYFVDGLVNGVAYLVAGIGNVVRRSQTSYVRNYALTMVAGIVLVLFYLIMR